MPEHLLTWPVGEQTGAPRALTIGVFDGVHLGHRALLQRLRDEAAAHDLVPTVLTFEPHPLAVVAPERAPDRLMSTACRLHLLQAAGAAAVTTLRFDLDVAALSPDEFVRDVLRDRLDARLAVVSAAFRFGHGARGDVAALRRIGRETGIEVIEVPPLGIDGRRVSSTRIRSAVRSGDVAVAARLLGRPHGIEGVVERGAARGRMIGFPTANLGAIDVLLPAEGIYAGWARWDDEIRPAAVHVGRRLTFEGAFTVEAHLLDTDVDLYGRRLAVGFVERLREDMRFSGPKELAVQIARDVDRARRILAPLAPGAAVAGPATGPESCPITTAGER